MNALVSDQMKAKGFTDQSLGERVGLGRSMVTKIRLGTAKPSLRQAIKLGEVLELSPAAFLPAAKEAEASAA